MFVSKPDDIKVEEWSAKLPTNHIVVSLIDMNETKSSQKLCTACERENETESACSWCVNCGEALCKSCDRYHRRSKASTNHKLIELGAGVPNDIPLHHADVFCKEHPENKVKAFCSDHSAICCMTCVMLKHRKCDNVGSIEDAAEEKKQSDEVKEYEDKLNGFKTSLEAFVQNRVDNLQNLDANIKRIKLEVDTLYKELSKHLEELKTNFMLEITKVEKEIKPEIEDERDEMKSKIAAIDNSVALFQTNMKHAPPAQFIQAMEKLIEQKTFLENYLKDQSRKIKDIEVTFNTNEKVLEMKSMIQEFGKLNVNRSYTDVMLHPTQATVSYVCMRSVEPILSSKVWTGVDIEGIALLECGQVVLSSSDTNTVELRDPNCSDVLSDLSVQGRPHGLKMTGDTEGAVAVQERGLVLFKVQNNQIRKVSEIHANVNYDFVYHKGRYYIGCGNKIRLYNRNRNRYNYSRISEISVNNEVGYMALCDESSLCYTGYGGNSVYCVRMDGAPVFTYSSQVLRCTVGVTVDSTGFIYVCGYTSRNVHQLSQDGKLQRIIFNNLKAGPNCITLNVSGDEVVIGCNKKVLLFSLI
ncbi:hypothetical protein FSP39_022910 [Pinctada imbricata]|uniref:B box-type domain-containing protein n=1 Tax=Pinctada imbricata TaxID=66713 RepID=A0AA88YXK6_PINIB|nr:hypothetical protein FSP39_022910 [Pinctada imbricata]